MKKLATCAVAITGFIGTSAFAADMGVPAAPPPAPVWSWTGWYAGVNLGASFGRAQTDFNVAPVSEDLHSLGAGLIKIGLASPGFAGSNTEYPDGFMGGGQIGYNWQFSPIWVVGFEADFQGAIEKDHNTLTSNFTAIPSGTSLVTGSPGSTVLDYQTKIEWFGTARLRAGYVWGNGNVFSYVTGGLAYGKVDVGGTFSTSLVPLTATLGGVSITTPSIPADAFGHSEVNTGWVLGYGTEGRLGISNWTWKVEGLYMDLGHLDAVAPGFSLSAPQTMGFAASTTGGGATTHTHFTDGILRGGLNYKFY